MRGFRIGRLFGIDLRVDWSWVFIFVLLTWNLDAVFARWHPGWGRGETFLVATSASLVFFGCVVLHELAHSVVAKAFGTPVRSITLFLFGGVSNIEHEPSSAKAEFFTAIVGPATSIALGAGAIAASSAARIPLPASGGDDAWAALSSLGPIATLAAWLGPINVAIGLFNMVPGFPLDGGRVLRSLVWAVTGDLRIATRWAGVTGQAIAWFFIACGIAMSFGARVPFFGSGWASGLWLAFIGWFLHGAASQAAARLRFDEALAGMTVEQLMRRGGPVATPDMPVAALVHEHLIPGDDRGLPVVRDGVLQGLVSVADVRRVVPESWPSTPVRSIMSDLRSLRVTRPGDPLVNAFEELARSDIEQMPVLENGKLVGMLRRRDVARWLEVAWRLGGGGGREGAHHPAA